MLHLRVLAASEPAAEAASRLAELFWIDRRHGPRPSRTDPQTVRYDLTGRLRATPTTTGQAPLAEIQDRKAHRDLPGELAASTGHWAAMEAQPWWPPQPGDIAIGHPDGRYSATFLAVRWPRTGEVRFKTIFSTVEDDATPRGGYGIEDLWFAWPAISIVRAGTIDPPCRPTPGAGP